jgi:hypothetical protein
MNHTNDPLSPATRAVYDAFNRVGLYNEPTFETDRMALAAAFLAAADQVVPSKPWEHDDVCEDIRSQLLSIAKELNPGTVL